MRVAKTLAGVVDLKRARNDAFPVAGAGILCSVTSMFEASDAVNPWKGCKFHVTIEACSTGAHRRWMRRLCGT